MAIRVQLVVLSQRCFWVNCAQCEPHNARPQRRVVFPVPNHPYAIGTGQNMNFSSIVWYCITIPQLPRRSRPGMKFVSLLSSNVEGGGCEGCNGKWQLHGEAIALRSNVWPFIQMANPHVLHQTSSPRLLMYNLGLRTHVPSSCWPTVLTAFFTGSFPAFSA